MAVPSATRRPGGGVSAVVIDLDEQITTEENPTPRPRSQAADGGG